MTGLTIIRLFILDNLHTGALELLSTDAEIFRRYPEDLADLGEWSLPTPDDRAEIRCLLGLD